MRILAAVGGSANANRAAAHALLLAGGRADVEIIFVNVRLFPRQFRRWPDGWVPP
jgi:nucleotide-binding universal stress UspA family protein